MLSDKNHGCFNNLFIESLSRDIARVHSLGTELCIVIGGGNIMRGSTCDLSFMHKLDADYTGMLATIINSIVLRSAL